MGHSQWPQREAPLPPAIHRAVGQLMVKVWDQVESELRHRSQRKGRLEEKVAHCATKKEVCELSPQSCLETAAGVVQCGSQALHRLLPTGYAQD